MFAASRNSLMAAWSRRCSSIPVPKPLHLLLYTYTADALEKRAPHRSAHLAAARAAEQRGQLVLGGALADPLDGGVLVFAGGREVAEAFATSDPYTQNGIVIDWTVREWTVVVGSVFAQLPAPPPFVPTYEWQTLSAHLDQAELPAGLEITLPLDPRQVISSSSSSSSSSIHTAPTMDSAQSTPVHIWHWAGSLSALTASNRLPAACVRCMARQGSGLQGLVRFPPTGRLAAPRAHPGEVAAVRVGQRRAPQWILAVQQRDARHVSQPTAPARCRPPRPPCRARAPPARSAWSSGPCWCPCGTVGHTRSILGARALGPPPACSGQLSLCNSAWAQGCSSESFTAGSASEWHEVAPLVTLCGSPRHRLGSEAPLDGSQTAEEVEMFRRASEVVVEVD